MEEEERKFGRADHQFWQAAGGARLEQLPLPRSTSLCFLLGEVGRVSSSLLPAAGGAVLPRGAQGAIFCCTQLCFPLKQFSRLITRECIYCGALLSLRRAVFSRVWTERRRIEKPGSPSCSRGLDLDQGARRLGVITSCFSTTRQAESGFRTKDYSAAADSEVDRTAPPRAEFTPAVDRSGRPRVRPHWCFRTLTGSWSSQSSTATIDRPRKRD